MIKDASITSAQRNLDRHAQFYILYPERGNDLQQVCRSTDSAIYLRLSKKETAIVWDLRFLDLIEQSYWGLLNFKDYKEICGDKTTGEYHLLSVIMVRLAEKAISPANNDHLLAIGLMYQNSVYFHHSVPALIAHADELDVVDKNHKTDLILFKNFIFEHEIAHHEFKVRKRVEWLQDDYLTKMTATKKLLDNRLSDLRTRKESVNPIILEMFEGIEHIYSNKMLFEEIFADTVAMDTLFKNETATMAMLMPPLKIWLFAKSILIGLAVLRMLSISEILIKAKTIQEFDELIKLNRYLFNTRKLFMEGMLRYYIMGDPDTDDPERDIDFEYKRIDQLSYELSEKTLTIEGEFRKRFEDGFIKECRDEGIYLRDNYELTPENLIQLCAEKLGWMRLYEMIP